MCENVKSSCTTCVKGGHDQKNNSSIGYSRSKSRSEMGRESALSKKKSPLSLQQYLLQQAYIGRTTPNNTLLPYTSSVAFMWRPCVVDAAFLFVQQFAHQS